MSARSQELIATEKRGEFIKSRGEIFSVIECPETEVWFEKQRGDLCPEMMKVNGNRFLTPKLRTLSPVSVMRSCNTSINPVYKAKDGNFYKVMKNGLQAVAKPRILKENSSLQYNYSLDIYDFEAGGVISAEEVRNLISDLYKAEKSEAFRRSMEFEICDDSLELCSTREEGDFALSKGYFERGLVSRVKESLTRGIFAKLIQWGSLAALVIVAGLVVKIVLAIAMCAFRLYSIGGICQMENWWAARDSDSTNYYKVYKKINETIETCNRIQVRAAKLEQDVSMLKKEGLYIRSPVQREVFLRQKTMEPEYSVLDREAQA